MVKFLMQLFSACYQKLIKAEKENRMQDREKKGKLGILQAHWVEFQF